MACPLCGDECHCHAPHAIRARRESRASLNSHQTLKSRTALASDDEGIDRSEEQFAASLEEEQFGSATLEEAAEKTSPADEVDYRTRAAERAATGIERRMAEERALEQQAERWRDEVSSRIE